MVMSGMHAAAKPLLPSLYAAVRQMSPIIDQVQALGSRLPRTSSCQLLSLRSALKVEAPSTQDLLPEDAWSLLQELTRSDARGVAQPMVNSGDKRRRVRDALLVAVSSSFPAVGWVHDAEPQPEVLLGVLASDIRLAVRALRDYCSALGLAFVAPESRVPGAAVLPAISGPVYVKYNSRTGVCYASRYEGRDRGVLVQLGTQQVGHLPLGLHDESMSRPPPAL